MSTVRPPMFKPLLALAPGVAALTLLLAACGGTQYRFVGDGEAMTFKVPEDWTEFERDTILRASGLDDAQVANSFTWLTAYDADTDATVQHVLSDVPGEPTVLAYVRRLSPSARDQFSLRTIRNALYPIDQLVNDDQGIYLNGQDLVLEGGLRGSQDVFEVSGGVDFLAENEVLTVNQLGVVDPATDRFYFIALSCSAACYHENQDMIKRIADSWAVTER